MRIKEKSTSLIAFMEVSCIRSRNVHNFNILFYRAIGYSPHKYGNDYDTGRKCVFIEN